MHLNTSRLLGPGGGICNRLTAPAAGVAVCRPGSPHAHRGHSIMKAGAVDYVRPRSLSEAVEHLAAATEGEARVIAGGQSLVAMMNLRIASPALLIDLARLPELV